MFKVLSGNLGSDASKVPGPSKVNDAAAILMLDPRP